jgi:hypothetical protein
VGQFRLDFEFHDLEFKSRLNSRREVSKSVSTVALESSHESKNPLRQFDDFGDTTTRFRVSRSLLLLVAFLAESCFEFFFTSEYRKSQRGCIQINGQLGARFRVKREFTIT